MWPNDHTADNAWQVGNEGGWIKSNIENPTVGLKPYTRTLFSPAPRLQQLLWTSGIL